jgi:hypothetical protein
MFSISLSDTSATCLKRLLLIQCVLLLGMQLLICDTSVGRAVGCRKVSPIGQSTVESLLSARRIDRRLAGILLQESVKKSHRCYGSITVAISINSLRLHLLLCRIL